MQYALLLWPYLNSRYELAVRPMLTRELSRLLEYAGAEPRVTWRNIGGLDFPTFDAAPLTERALDVLRTHSHLRLLLEVRPDGTMLPLATAREPELGGDLSSILKYKGKTSELFTRCLINLAAQESRFFDGAEGGVTLFDPMCGRGTTLFEALNRGWHAVGSDLDAKDVEQGYAFLKRYLEQGRFKHETKDFSMTIGRKAVKRRQITVKRPEGPLYASFIAGDLVDAASAHRPGSFHLVVSDIPYGVQHAPGGKMSLKGLLEVALPAMHRALKPGGAMALSFNAYTMKRDHLVRLVSDAGFEPLDSEADRNLSHWVEQAVLRDFVLARRA